MKNYLITPSSNISTTPQEFLRGDIRPASPIANSAFLP